MDIKYCYRLIKYKPFSDREQTLFEDDFDSLESAKNSLRNKQNSVESSDDWMAKDGWLASYDPISENIIDEFRIF